MSGMAMDHSGMLPFDSTSRDSNATMLAGVLAECGITSLLIEHPRVCQRREVKSRETDLPRELLGAAVGTTFRGEGIALLVDDGCLRWVATAAIADALRSVR